MGCRKRKLQRPTDLFLSIQKYRTSFIVHYLKYGSLDFITVVKFVTQMESYIVTSGNFVIL